MAFVDAMSVHSVAVVIGNKYINRFVNKFISIFDLNFTLRDLGKDLRFENARIEGENTFRRASTETEFMWQLSTSAAT